VALAGPAVALDILSTPETSGSILIGFGLAALFVLTRRLRGKSRNAVRFLPAEASI
jgi:hypothetical protein